MDQVQIGRFIAERRRALGFTQQALADALGLSNRTISKWECGGGLPDMEHVLPLCRAIDITADELLGGSRGAETIPIEGKPSSVLERIAKAAAAMEKEYDSRCERCGREYRGGMAEWVYDRHYRGWLTYSDRVSGHLCAECAIAETEETFTEADARRLLNEKPAACGDCGEHFPYCVSSCPGPGRFGR